MTRLESFRACFNFGFLSFVYVGCLAIAQPYIRSLRWRKQNRKCTGISEIERGSDASVGDWGRIEAPLLESSRRGGPTYDYLGIYLAASLGRRHPQEESTRSSVFSFAGFVPTCSHALKPWYIGLKLSEADDGEKIGANKWGLMAKILAHAPFFWRLLG